MKLTAALSLLTLLTSLPTTAGAQTGPWTDGELILLNGQGAYTINRIVPETGASAVLISPQYFGGWAGSMVFDSFRGGLLANISLPPDNTFFFRLWLVSHDGTAAAMPGLTGNVRALASTGDGRVFFIRHTGATQGPQNVEYFDANNIIQTLKASDGVTPFQADVEHLLYDAPSNALIGSSSVQWAATNCAPALNSVYRIPLSADGTKVDGAMSCASFPTTLIYGDIMKLDNLPDGNVLVTTASAFLGAPHGLISLNPVTLAMATWATPAQYDINGGVWSARLGKAVIHANSGAAFWEPSGLRTFSAGQAQFGGYIATGIPDNGGGYSPNEILFEVDTNGPACDGFAIPYGTGLAGNGAAVPSIGAIGCPDIGNPFTLSINDVNGGAAGLLFVGLSSGAIPFKGGTFLLGSVAAQFSIAVGGTPGLAGAGFLAMPAVLSSPLLIGVNIYLQAGFADGSAVHDVSLTNGLRLQGN